MNTRMFNVSNFVRRAIVLVSVLVAIPPLPTCADSLIFDGTSLTAGSVVPPGKSYPSQLVASIEGVWTQYNFGVRGQKGDAMLADFGTQIAPLFNPNERQAVVFDMGVNDLTAGDSVEVVESRYDQYFAACTNAGWSPRRIFILPIGPSFFAGNFKTATRAEVNTYLLANYPHNVIEPSSEPRIFADGANLNTNLFADLTHPNAEGCALEAAAVRRKMIAEGFLPSALGVALYPGVTINGEIGDKFQIEWSEDLKTWVPIQTLTLEMSPQIWFDSQAVFPSRRYYRASIVP